MKPAISVTGLGKKFTIHSSGKPAHRNLREDISHAFRRIISPDSSPPETEEFWALKDVSFDIPAGDVVGILGKNGAGKSTLLKILSRITPPTEGRVIISGRIGALLEVGTGFHPELSGRENIFMNGAILGMKKEEITRKFDEIVAFAEVEKFIDTPVKHYSSGMYVRLAFSVAAHCDPEILIVDEVLAVGDAAFQKKCLGKIGSVSSDQGRTVLFVSHNMQAISTLTKNCLVLKEGKIQFSGSSPDAIVFYLQENQLPGETYTAPPDSEKPTVTLVRVVTSDPANIHKHAQQLVVDLEITTPWPVQKAAVSIQIVNSYNDSPIVHSWIFDSEQPMLRSAGVHKLRCVIPKTRLYMGKYSVSVHLAGGSGTANVVKYETLRGICQFEVVMFAMDRELPWVPGTCQYLEDSFWEIDGPD